MQDDNTAIKFCQSRLLRQTLYCAIHGRASEYDARNESRQQRDTQQFARVAGE